MDKLGLYVQEVVLVPICIDLITIAARDREVTMEWISAREVLADE